MSLSGRNLGKVCRVTVSSSLQPVPVRNEIDEPMTLLRYILYGQIQVENRNLLKLHSSS